MKIDDNKTLCPDEYTIIDAHAHLGVLASFFMPDISVKGIIGLMDLLNIKSLCVSQLESLYQNASEGNSSLFKIIQTFPDRFYGYCTCNPHEVLQTRMDLAGYMVKKEFIGIKIHPDSHRYPVDGPLYNIVWEYAVSNNVPVLAHSWEDSDFCNSKRFHQVLTVFPKLILLLGHSGGTYTGFRKSCELVNKFPNVYMELCGCEYSNVWLIDFIKEISYKRIIFGTDQIFHDPRFLLGRVLYADISRNIKKAILGDNFSRILNRKN